MNLQAIIYLIGLLEPVTVILTLVAIVTSVCIGLLGLNYINPEETHPYFRDNFQVRLKKAVVLLFVLITVNIFIPTKETAYLMLASEVGQPLVDKYLK